MGVQHWLKITALDGTNVRFIAQNPPGNDPTKGGFSSLVYSSVVNGYGTCAFALYGNHAILPLADYSLVEVWRSWPEQGIAPYIDWSGIFRDEEGSVNEQGGDLFYATCFEDEWFLSTRAVAWPAGTDLRSQFTADKGETIMKNLATYNISASATAAAGRDEDGAITGVTVEADGAHGSTIDWNCANENLLDTLAKMAPGAGGDFALAKTAAATWQFRWYTGQLGTDRTTSVKFSLELGNMARPRYKNIRSGEKTVALVKGLGTGSQRAAAIRTGANYNAANKTEMYVNASFQATTKAALNAAGDAATKASQAQEVIQFDALPWPNTVFGKHWFLGDKLTVKYKSHTLTPKVVMVTRTIDPLQGEVITPLMAVNV